MSKIGRKPIHFEKIKAEIEGQTVVLTGTKSTVKHELPSGVQGTIEGKNIMLSVVEGTRENKTLWGLHRALLANKVTGLEKGFSQVMKIVGLGFKAQLSDNKLIFSLGYSHKIDYELPSSVTVDIDKTGQLLTVKSPDKFLLGNVCDKIRSFRPPEPYKGTGVMRQEEVIIRKAGKTGSK